MQTTEKKAGLLAGISLIVMAIAAGFSYGHVYNSLVVDAPETTFLNLINNKSLFLAGLAGWVLILITDLIVAIALFRYFRSTAKPASLLTAMLRIVYTVILGIAIIQLFRIIPLLSADVTNGYTFPAFDVVLRLQLFESIWSLGLIIFGLHLLGLGYLSVKAASVPSLLGYLLYLSGVLYVLVHAARHIAAFDPDVVSKVENIASLPMALGEMLLALWLIYKGFKRDKSSVPTATSASV